MNRTTMGQQLRQLRVELGITQRQVAQRCHLSQSHIAAYEAGTRPISPTQEQKIRGALKVSPSVTLRAHAGEVRRIAAEHGATKVRVFGSVARGEDRFDSDIDLLVTLRDGVGLFDLVAMKDELEGLLETRVDIVSEGGLKERDEDIVAQAVIL